MNEKIFKRLRYKFVIISTSMMLIMMIAICLTVYLSMAHSLKQNSLEVLDYTAEVLIRNAAIQSENADSSGTSTVEARSQSENSASLSQASLDTFLLRNVYVVYYDATGYIMKASQGNRVIEHMYTLGRELSDVGRFEEEPQGIVAIRENDYRYKQITINNDRILLLISRDGELASLPPLLAILVIVGLASIVILLFACSGLAGVVIRPIEKAWDTQHQFLHDASHELKTPLAVIATNLEAVRSSPDETVASQDKWLGYAADEVQEMRRLVNDMFALAINERPDAEQRSKPFVPFSLSETVIEAGLINEANALEAGIELELDVEEDLWMIGYRDGIKRVVMILLDNALKNTFAGGKITLELHRSRNDLYVSCTNTGHGIPKEELQNIFKRFYRLDSSRARQSGGTGLGLAIAEGTIQKHGGKIWAESELEQYARFIFKLPATTAPEDKE